MAPTLEASLRFSNTGLGMLLAVVSITGAVATLGAGVLIDRYNRTRLLAGALTLWVVAMAAGALAQSFTFLLLSRVALGVVLATVGPAAASLVGDLYSDDRRGQVMSWIRTGDLLGVAIAFLLVGSVTWLLSWRAVFVTLAFLGAVVAWQMWKTAEPGRSSAEGGTDAEDRQIQVLVEAQGVGPGPDGVVLEESGRDLSLPRVVRYALAIRTNRILLVAEAVGDFALSAVAAFAVLYATKQYHISQPLASVMLPVAGAGALAGVLGGGWLGD